MDISLRKLFFPLIIFLLVFTLEGYAGEDKRLYSEAVRAARKGKDDFAFMKFNLILEMHPKSKLLERALFATGEYYFQIRNYYDASVTFKKFVLDYPNSKAKLFALVYLLEIARKLEKERLINAIEKEIVTFWQVSLFFRNYKTYKYTSPFSKRYKALYFIDRVEFYIDGQFLTKAFF